MFCLLKFYIQLCLIHFCVIFPVESSFYSHFIVLSSYLWAHTLWTHILINLCNGMKQMFIISFWVFSVLYFSLPPPVVCFRVPITFISILSLLGQFRQGLPPLQCGRLLDSIPTDPMWFPLWARVWSWVVFFYLFSKANRILGAWF